MCIKHTVKRACPTVGTRLEDIALLLNLIPIKIKLLPCCGDWFSKIIALLWGKLSRMLAPLKYNNIKFLKLGLALLAAIVSYAALWSYRYRPHIAPMSIDARLAVWWRVTGPVTPNNFNPASPIYTYLSNPISEFTNHS